MDNGHFGGMHFWGWLFWALLLAGIFLSFWLVFARRKAKDTPLDILQKRFARGEISKEEFEERKRVLADTGSGKVTQP